MKKLYILLFSFISFNSFTQSLKQIIDKYNQVNGDQTTMTSKIHTYWAYTTYEGSSQAIMPNDKDEDGNVFLKWSSSGRIPSITQNQIESRSIGDTLFNIANNYTHSRRVEKWTVYTLYGKGVRQEGEAFFDRKGSGVNVIVQHKDEGAWMKINQNGIISSNKTDLPQQIMDANIQFIDDSRKSVFWDIESLSLSNQNTPSEEYAIIDNKNGTVYYVNKGTFYLVRTSEIISKKIGNENYKYEKITTYNDHKKIDDYIFPFRQDSFYWEKNEYGTLSENHMKVIFESIKVNSKISPSLFQFK